VLLGAIQDGNRLVRLLKNTEMFESVTQSLSGQIVCNLCGSTEFVAMNTCPNAKCVSCARPWREPDSFIYILANFSFLNPISSMVDARDYTTADIEPHRFPFARNIIKFDMCSDANRDGVDAGMNPLAFSMDLTKVGIPSDGGGPWYTVPTLGADKTLWFV
jgi:hypothetical protein